MLQTICNYVTRELPLTSPTTKPPKPSYWIESLASADIRQLARKFVFSGSSCAKARSASPPPPAHDKSCPGRAALETPKKLHLDSKNLWISIPSARQKPRTRPRKKFILLWLRITTEALRSWLCPTTQSYNPMGKRPQPEHGRWYANGATIVSNQKFLRITLARQSWGWNPPWWLRAWVKWKWSNDQKTGTSELLDVPKRKVTWCSKSYTLESLEYIKSTG